MKLKERLIYWLARKLLPTLNGDIIIFKNNQAFLNGTVLNEKEKNNLKAEADYIEQTRVWEIINSNLIKITQDKLYREATDITQILFAKTILYTLDIQKQILDKCKTLKS